MGKWNNSSKSRNRPALAWRLTALALVFILLLTACNFPTAERMRQRTPMPPWMLSTLVITPLVTPPPTPQVAQIETAAVVTVQPGEPPAPPPAPGAVWSYVTQSGDTLPALLRRFGVGPERMRAAQALPAEGLIPPGVAMLIENGLEQPVYPQRVLPDSEVVYSPSSAGFDVQTYVTQAGGFLSGYSEAVESETLTGAQIVQRVAEENSINPRLLLAVLEYQSGWVRGQPRQSGRTDHPLGFFVNQFSGLRRELLLAVRFLNQGYFGWRDGSRVELEFAGDRRVRMAPNLNAGSAALQQLFSKLYAPEAFPAALYGETSLPVLYAEMFGDPNAQAAAVGPILPAELQQPPMLLPFSPGEPWSFTGGPHIAWGNGSPLASLDFAPVTGEPACAVSRAWVRAAASGLVVRSRDGAVALDLDGDGYEQTGWVLLYMHVAKDGRVAEGTRVSVDDPIGHPSCEGGAATGTHVHLARKYNGEWIPAGLPLPFVLSGWVAVPGEKPYLGILINGEQQVSAKPDGSRGSQIRR